MSLTDVFDSVVEAAFTIFADFVKSGKYIVTPGSSGWGESTIIPDHSMDVIINGLSQKNIRNSAFIAQIQPTDTIIMAKGVDIRNTVKRVKNGDEFSVKFIADDEDSWETFNIVTHDTDPAEALFLILLRKL